MKKKWMSNLSLKIASIVVAFLFWLVIINITDPTTSKTFFDIPVKVLNENVIISANQVYEIVDGDTVRVTVKGKRSFVQTLSENDFTATADLAELSKVNAVNINVKLNKSSNSGVELNWDNAVMKVSLEKRITQKFKVQVEHEGELSENYVLGEMVAKPNIVEVSCGESKFKKIDHVGVMVSLNGQSENFEAEYSPVLYDSEGDALDDGNVTFSNNSIRVSTEVRETKKVAVFVKITGTPSKGYQLLQTDYKPENIRVTGPAAQLSQNIVIKIPVSVEGAKKDVEKEISLQEYLPEHIEIVDDVTTLSVRCEIEKEGERTFTISPTDIAVKNLPRNSTMEFHSSHDKYKVVVQGKEDKLSQLKIVDLGAYVDLENLQEGEYVQEVHFTVPDDLKIKNKIKIKVTIKKGNEELEEATATPENIE